MRAGGWLFRHRSWLPVPLALTLLVVPAGEARPWLVLAGTAIVTAGEVIRLWAVHHIGVISRTRSDRLGPLVSTGPFAMVRNPLYAGNILLWMGFAIAAGLAWLAPIVAAVLALEYHAIVTWEEQLLEARRGSEYRAYTARVPRWVPQGTASGWMRPPAAPFSWRETFFSERGTLLAIALGALLLYVKGKSAM